MMQVCFEIHFHLSKDGWLEGLLHIKPFKTSGSRMLQTFLFFSLFQKMINAE
jgi:hypothetical protein